VKSPGKPVEPITLELMQSFTAPMLSRNPVLHYVFARMELAEERGLGLKSMKARAEAAGLPLPRFAWKAPYLVLTIYRSPAAAVRGLGVEVSEGMSKAERAGWEWLATKQTVTSFEYAAAMRLPNRTALNHLKHFGELGLVRKLGSGAATRYEVTRPRVAEDGTVIPRHLSRLFGGIGFAKTIQEASPAKYLAEMAGFRGRVELLPRIRRRTGCLRLARKPGLAGHARRDRPRRARSRACGVMRRWCWKRDSATHWRGSTQRFRPRSRIPAADAHRRRGTVGP